MGLKILPKMSFKIDKKGSQELVETGVRMGLQSKCSDPLPTFIDCQKDSGSTGENGTQVKPVLLALKIFAVYLKIKRMGGGPI